MWILSLFKGFFSPSLFLSCSHQQQLGTRKAFELDKVRERPLRLLCLSLWYVVFFYQYILSTAHNMRSKFVTNMWTRSLASFFFLYVWFFLFLILVLISRRFIHHRAKGKKNTRQHTRLRHQPNEVIIHPLAAYYSKPPPKDRNKETLKYSDSKTRERKTGENYFHVLSQFSFSLLFSSRYFAVCFKLISCWLVALFLTHPFRIVSSSLSSNWVLLWGRKYLLSF